MSEQVFISYRRDGGDAQAKLICSELTRRGYSVFFDYDSIQGGYFDSRIFSAIEGCNDFILVLPYGSLERCCNEEDWVRLEIRHALQCRKNIIPILMDGYSFPSYLPPDIDEVRRYNGLEFNMRYFDAMMDSIMDHMMSTAGETSSYTPQQSYSAPYSPEPVRPIQTIELVESRGLEIKNNIFGGDCRVVGIGSCTDKVIVIPKQYNGRPVTAIGNRAFQGKGRHTGIIMQEGITKIGKYAFFESDFVSITIPLSVKKIGNAAFVDTFHLKEVIYNGSRYDWYNIDRPLAMFFGKYLKDEPTTFLE